MIDNIHDMPQTPKEIAKVMAEARVIFGNLKEHHSRALLMCLSSELRKWEWAELESFRPAELGLMTCQLCGQAKPDALDAEEID